MSGRRINDDKAPSAPDRQIGASLGQIGSNAAYPPSRLPHHAQSRILPAGMRPAVDQKSTRYRAGPLAYVGTDPCVQQFKAAILSSVNLSTHPKDEALDGWW
jgi:hypothetical protein